MTFVKSSPASKFTCLHIIASLANVLQTNMRSSYFRSLLPQFVISINKIMINAIFKNLNFNSRLLMFRNLILVLNVQKPGGYGCPVLLLTVLQNF